MSSAEYIHGTTPSEQVRLSALNRITNAAFVEFLEIGAGMRVLEAGSGLGILGASVAAAADGVQVIGVERSGEQLAAAVRAPGVTYVQGDAHHLEFEDATFDLVYARYLLEHVADPERVVREMRRVVRPGGRVVVCENDISLFRIDPPCVTFEEVWAAFARLQAKLGGDALIGRRLFRLFRQAGFDEIVLSVQPELHSYGSANFEAWIENLVGNLEGGRAGLVDSGLCTKEQVDRAIAELRERITDRDASSVFIWNRASAIR